MTDPTLCRCSIEESRMYPSGRWRGYWDQAGWGRQSMRDLVLRFSAGEVEGQGADMVGSFTFHGTYDSAGVVTLIKTT